MRCVLLKKAHVAGYWRTTEHGQRVWVEGYDTRRMRHEEPVHHEAATTGTRAIVVDAATMAEMTQAEQAKARARRQKIARGLSDSELASRRLELEQQGVHHGLNRQRLTEHQRVWLSLVQEQERRVREAKDKPPPLDDTPPSPPEDTPPPTLREKRWNDMTREDLLDRYRSASDFARNRRVTPAERLRWQIEADTLSTYLQRRFPDWTPPVPPPPQPPLKQRKDMTHAECFATFQHHLRESENDQLSSAQRSFHRMDAHSMAAHMRDKWPEQADPVNLHRWSEMHEAALVQELVQLVGFTLNDRIPPLEQQKWKKQADHLAAHIKERFPGRTLLTDTPPVPPEPPLPPPTPPKPPLRRAPNWTRLGKPKRDIWQTTNVTEGRYHNAALNHPNVSAGVVAAIQKAPPLMRVVDQPDKTDSYYLGQMLTDSCTVVMGDREQGSTYKDAVWRHEFGHHIDRVMHGDIPLEVYRTYSGRYDGQRYASMDAVGEIRQDGDALIAGHDQRYSTETYAIRDQINARIDARLQEGGADETAILQDEMARAGLDPKELWAMYPAMHNRRMMLTNMLVGLATKNPYWVIPNSSADHGARGMLEDFFNAVTGGRQKFSVGHPDSYYNEGVKTSVPGYTENHTTEAFANWFHMHGAPHTCYRVLMQKLAPKTCAAFERRVNTWLTT